jgi:hypothetical protein
LKQASSRAFNYENENLYISPGSVGVCVCWRMVKELEFLICAFGGHEAVRFTYSVKYRIFM